MSEPHVPVPDPEDEGETRGDLARCPDCGVVLRRTSLDEWRCIDHGVVRPYYGNPREDEKR